ncbi:MAG: hypothetical protein ACYTXY_22590, partial [Nostoc sp.]
MANSIDFTIIPLPNVIKLKLEFLDDVNLVSSSSGIYLDFDHDLQLNLDKIFSTHSTVPYIDVIFDRIIVEIFGKPEIRISEPKYKIYKTSQEVELSFKGLLNNQGIELFFGKQTTLKYKLKEDFIFSNIASKLPIINVLKLSNPELIITDTEHDFIHSKLGCINLSRGFNFIGNIDFNNLQTNFSSFIH